MHSCGLRDGGEVVCWGLNDSGQLGDGTTGNRLTPTLVTGALTFAAVETGNGGFHTCGLDASGKAYCWGSNAQGQLGDGTTANRLSPTEVAHDPELFFASLAVGGGHSCGVTAVGGTAYCWGANGNGQLGDGTLSDRRTPVLVSDP